MGTKKLEKTDWAQQQNTHVRTRLDKEHKQHWSINTKGVLGKQNTPGNDWSQT